MTRPLIIAHRGACAYLPEHSRGAKALAYGMGADYLEQDIVATRDGELLVLHDETLDDVSDVADRFSGRVRDDGRHYCIDFDLAEIRMLTFRERLDPETGAQRFPDRYPRVAGGFPVVTLEDEIRFVAQMNRSTGREVGIYPEIKSPAWHLEQGFDLTAAVLRTLERAGYLAAGRKIFLQCFDPPTLKAVRAEVGPTLPLIQLLSSKTAITDALLDDIATYATGIGPALALIRGGRDAQGKHRLTDLMSRARSRGLLVHPYTFRADALPDGFQCFDELLELFIERAGVDGLFTDCTDRVARYRAAAGT
ncbi:MAG: glycerophosphodiester phosphodiesterase [Gammaproteobacteria bacterium]|nr:MAG: glycerophosphodiester phosphodiesterase [Gammaproteobacteria bacterium]